MIKITDKSKCCGCEACVQVCPANCIVFTTDSEGFAYPQVDYSKCINCNRCEKVCPIINIDKISISDTDNIQTYLAYSYDDDLRLKSSSGGIFTALAEKVIESGGVVCGAAFDENFLVHHICVDNVKGLSLLRGSKYLQSRIEDVYLQIKKLLDCGKTVLFTGTACQIAGLYSFLGKRPVNLITMDVICHGVPSPAVWKRYIDEKEAFYGAAVRQTFFRSKNCGWKTFALSLSFANDKAYEKVFSNDSFMRLFLKNICLRPSCYTCVFKGEKINSDITVGDAWGIQNHSPEMDDDKGVSVVVIHSSKGEKLFNNIGESLCVKRVDPLSALAANSAYYEPVSPHINRKKFFDDFNNGKSIEKLLYLVKPTFCERVRGKIKFFYKKIFRR